ncbi:MAG TPA: BON domain-containing protein [Candidatus Acidoferrum sp.]|nr:BON domain-containing protein [Candidatus Acidoferrum sp.]
MPKIFLPVSLIVVLLGFSIGCSKHASDDTITKEIQKQVAADPQTKDSNVTVTSKDGKVTLTGTASSQAAQQKLEQIARQEPGISAVDNQISVPPPPPPPPPIVVPAGTDLVVTTSQALGSKLSQTGQTFLASVAQTVSVDGQTAIPKGSAVSGTVVTAKEKGKIKGEGQLSLTLKSVTVNGQTYPIRTATLDSTVKGKGKRTAATTGGGAAGGALIGGIAGGGKGAGIGALVGAGAGFVGGAFTGNKQIELPAESALTFSFSAPLTLPPPSQ